MPWCVISSCNSGHPTTQEESVVQCWTPQQEDAKHGLASDHQRRLYKSAWQKEMRPKYTKKKTDRRERRSGHVRSENVAVDATQVAHLVGVDASTLGPVTDGSKAQDEAIETAAVKNAQSTKVLVACVQSTQPQHTVHRLPETKPKYRSHNAQTTAIQRAQTTFRGGG